jgi:UDPglucose--hexose-1-phosphate uridylyltransferase
MNNELKPEIRRNYFKDNYAIIAPLREGRQKFTNDTAAICHFCPENITSEIVTYQLDNQDNQWEIISVINKFAALSLNNPTAYGQAEVIIETREHGVHMGSFSVDHIIRIIDSYISRFNNLINTDGIKYVSIFKNDGKQAGASIPHAHSQIIALPIVPPKIIDELDSYKEYLTQHEVCPYCKIIQDEIKSERCIFEDNNILVLAPYASRYPYEAWVMPKRHVNLFSDLSEEEKKSFALAIRTLAKTLEEIECPYNFYIENTINNDDYHTKIRFTPRKNIRAGLELNTDIVVNTISPEYAAEIYRNQFEQNEQS